ncbi:secreted RxLR effector protein 78-like [Vicia villosa]|uniref:secreted RxLR effector protein 78-like n=1 Tax=Vicia villosa TaxID=3911 RepID=UPI00273ACFD6|nr:secreted RxLR effector protein 78-like [Vicia villosa]
MSASIKGVISKLVSINQSAFVPGRNILDRVLLINETMDMARREKRGCVVMKVDFEKAYDCVSWDFLRFMLVKMGFGLKWLSWMESCIFSSHTSIIINGSTTKDFRVEKGLRQGDPISPFLFVLVTEALTSLMKKAVEI